MAVVPESLLESGFPLLLEDSPKKCQVRRLPVFLYNEHWVNATMKEYHVDVVLKANDSPTSWFFEGPQMETGVSSQDSGMKGAHPPSRHPS